jgi:hypothetical protein
VKLASFCFCLAYAMAPLGQAQHSSMPPAAAAQADSASDLPVRALDFRAEEPIQGMVASPVTVMPTQCNSAGTMFLEMVEPPDFTKHVVYAVSKDKSKGFSTSMITDIEGVQIINMFPSASTLAFLVSGTKNMTDGGQHHEVHYFISLFDLDGGYKNSIELQLHNFVPYHVAVLSSGLFLVSGFDRAEEMARLLVVGKSGTTLQTIMMPETLGGGAGSADALSKEGVLASGKLLGSILFTRYGEDVLIWRSGANARVLRIDGDGYSREIQIPALKGFVVGDIVPSDTNLLIHYRRDDQETGAPQNVSEYVYYEVRSADDSLASKITLGGKLPGMIACESGGSFLAYQTDDKGRFLRLVAQ